MIIHNTEEAKKYIDKNSKYFKSREFQCKHCGELVLDTELLNKLDELRERLGEPLILNCAYRCQEHNDSIRESAKNSQHVKGKAADVRTNPLRKDDIIELSKSLGFSGIGVNYETFVHVDTRDGQKVIF